MTHATKNVSLCDLVIFLTRGGYLAFFGTSEEALTYFEQYWSERERRLKPTFEFDDIYNLLDPDKALGSGATEQQKLAAAAEWSKRYLRSSYYRTHVTEGLRHVKSGDLSANQKTNAQTTAGLCLSSVWHPDLTLLGRDATRPEEFAHLVAAGASHWADVVHQCQSGHLNSDNGNPMRALTTIFLAVIIVLLFVQ